MPWQIKSTIQMKKEFIEIIEENSVTMAETCRQFGISRKTGYKWKNRYDLLGEQGLCNQSRRPHTSIVVSEDLICEIIRLKYQFSTWGARKIRDKLILEKWTKTPIPSISSINRVLKNCGMIRPKKRNKTTIPSKRLDERLDVQFVNDEWSIDYKGWWLAKDGTTRCRPLTIRDSFSKFIICIKLTKGETIEEVKKAMEECFKKYGLPKSILSDNGTPFASTSSICGLTRLSSWWVNLGIKLVRARPGCPQDNGAHERMHRDMVAELECKRADTQEEMDKWRDCFNKERPHQALDGATPSSNYARSERKYSKKIKAFDYKKKEVRSVCSSGKMTYKGIEYFLSSALIKQKIGIEQVDENTSNVYFCNYKLGTIDTKNHLFFPVQDVKKGETPKFITGVQR